MALMDEAVWRGKIHSGGWVDEGGGDAAVIEPATGAELGRTGIATPARPARPSSRRPRSRPGRTRSPIPAGSPSAATSPHPF
jgi:benzaldehyde dehydrogenase (NAD)